MNSSVLRVQCLPSNEQKAQHLPGFAHLLHTPISHISPILIHHAFLDQLSSPKSYLAADIMNNWIAPQFLGGRSRYGQNRGIFNGPNNANIDSYRLGGYGGLSGLPLGGVNPLALRTPGIGALARRGLGRGLFAGAGQNLGLQLAPPALQAAQLAQLGASGVRGGLGYASGLNSLNSLAPLGYGAVGQSLMGRSSCGGLCTEDIRGAHVCQICAARGDALGVLAATEDAGCSCPYCYTNQLYSAYAADPMSL